MTGWRQRGVCGDGGFVYKNKERWSMIRKKACLREDGMDTGFAVKIMLEQKVGGRF